MADAKKKIDAFKNIPKLTELAKKSEGELISTFGNFAESLEAMMAALRGRRCRVPEAEEHQDGRGQRVSRA